MAETTEKPGLADGLPTDALKDAGQRLLGLLVQRAAEAATDRRWRFRRWAAETEVQRPTEKVKSAFGRGGGSGGRKKLKVTVISERQDVGLPRRTTYDLWTQFTDFPTSMTKVESAEQASDEKLNWKAQVF